MVVPVCPAVYILDFLYQKIFQTDVWNYNYARSVLRTIRLPTGYRPVISHLINSLEDDQIYLEQLARILKPFKKYNAEMDELLLFTRLFQALEQTQKQTNCPVKYVANELRGKKKVPRFNQRKITGQKKKMRKKTVLNLKCRSCTRRHFRNLKSHRDRLRHHQRRCLAKIKLLFRIRTTARGFCKHCNRPIYQTSQSATYPVEAQVVI